MQFSDISKGTIEDVEKILEMLVAVTDAMLESGINQWNYDYPDRKTILNDVASDSNFVIHEGSKIAASIVLNDVQDIQYKTVHWKYRNDSVLVIHRLGVHPEFQGKGYGKKMCLFAESYAKENGYKFIRLDAYAGNKVSNKMYERLGYSKANGYCYFRKKTIPFYCYEKEV